eukprot:scaffold179576_cov49-Attheya_sp.AAC.1
MPSIGTNPSFEVDTVMVDDQQSQQQKDDDETSGSKISKSELDESSDSSSGGGSEKQPDERSTFETKTGGSTDYMDAPQTSSPRNESMSPHTIDDDDDDVDEPEDSIEEEEEPSFETLGEAIRSPKATKEQVRSLCNEMVVSTEDRPLVWCKLICGKPLDDVSTSSVADSFQHWRTTSSSTSTTLLHTDQIEAYAKQIISKTDDSDDALQSLSSILLYHYQSSGPTSVMENDDDGESTNQVEWDPLLPPLASVLLSAGLDTTAANVLLSNIMPTSMPLMALSNEERWMAAKALHS